MGFTEFPPVSVGGSTGANTNRVLRASGTGGATVQPSTIALSDVGVFSAASGTLGLTAPAINGGTALGATSTELDQLNDVSAYQESIVAAGALSVTKVYSGLAVASGGAVTLAAPSATMLGQQKTIEMTTDDGDVTLALTNVVGQSSGTTATFNDAGDALVLLGLSSKWLVLKEFGITLS